MERGKLGKNTSDYLSGGKLTGINEKIVETIKAKRPGSKKEVYLLLNERKKLDDLDLELQGLKANNKNNNSQGSAMLKTEDDIPTLGKSSEQQSSQWSALR